MKAEKEKPYLQYKKTRKPNPLSLNPLKKKQRDLKRLLNKKLSLSNGEGITLNNHEGIPSDTTAKSTTDEIKFINSDNLSKNETRKIESEIQNLNQRIKQQQQLKKQAIFEEKYKYVRFVELKKSRKRKDGNQDYIEFYPIDCKYLSCYRECLEIDSQKRELIKQKIAEFREKGLLREGFKWRLESTDVPDGTAAETPAADEFFI